MKQLSLLIVTCLLVSTNVCYAQRQRTYTYIAHATLSGRPKSDTLVDKITSTKFIIDSARIYITAIDASGKQLWRTDAWKDNGLEEYRVKRPVIARFSFYNYYYGDSIIYVDKLKGRQVKEIERNRDKYSREVIAIAYNNTQFGLIDKKTGLFHFKGQD